MSDDMNIPIVGGADEPCGSCGAAMAPDQRYCLQCGTRRGEARVDFRRHLGEGAGPDVADAAPVAAVAAGPPVAPAKALTPLTIVGGIAILGVMLVLGVLIGKDNTPATTTPIASNPPKVVVQSSGSDTSSAPKTQTASNGNSSGGKNAGNAKPAKSTDTPVPNASPEALKKAGATTVDDNALKALDGNDTAANSKASADLPDTIATEGKPPKPDDKAPGAGGSATVIK